ncbi:hypothetical protein Ancab_029824 [Ancistrocladus abbreviatus]
MHYFNIPPPSPLRERILYPSMDPQRMGALVPSQEGGESKSGPEKQQPPPQQQQRLYGFQAMPPPQGQYQQPFYPPFSYMPPSPPQYQQYPPPYQSAMQPPRPPAPTASQT